MAIVAGVKYTLTRIFRAKRIALIIILTATLVLLIPSFGRRLTQQITTSSLTLDLSQNDIKQQENYPGIQVEKEKRNKEIHTVHDNPAPNDNCEPRKNYIFIKTDKTGGSTMTNIFFRFGIKHNLIAALDANRSYAIRHNSTSDEFSILKYNCSDFPGYNFIVHHIEYHRKAMDDIVKNATYVTILRSAASHVRSRYYYYGGYKESRNKDSLDPLLDYLRGVDSESSQLRTFSYPTMLNTQMTRFGGHRIDNESVIDARIKVLDKQLDFVLLTEYFDESLILLKQLMCWDFEDIVYHSLKVHKGKRPTMTQEATDIVKKWARQDIMLYDHFNNTFWEKVRRYKGNFTADLLHFRSLNKKVATECENATSQYCNLLKTDDMPVAKTFYDNQLKWVC